MPTITRYAKTTGPVLAPRPLGEWLHWKNHCDVLETVEKERDRLAQREAALESRLRLKEELNWAAIRRVESLEFDLTAAHRANEILGGKINRLEEELRRARGVSERTDQTNTDLRVALAASESRGRAYCLELAEKAGRIREPEEALGKALSASGWHKRQADGLEVSNIALGHRERVLEASIEDGIAHVERARQDLLGELDRSGLGMLGRQLIDDLDLAHEALSKASRSPGIGTAPAVPGPPAVMKRIDQLEEGLGRLGSATNPAGLRQADAPAVPSACPYTREEFVARRDAIWTQAWRYGETTGSNRTTQKQAETDALAAEDAGVIWRDPAGATE